METCQEIRYLEPPGDMVREIGSVIVILVAVLITYLVGVSLIIPWVLPC
jgi:hypothetical protein